MNSIEKSMTKFEQIGQECQESIEHEFGFLPKKLKKQIQQANFQDRINQELNSINQELNSWESARG